MQKSWKLKHVRISEVFFLSTLIFVMIRIKTSLPLNADNENM